MMARNLALAVALLCPGMALAAPEPAQAPIECGPGDAALARCMKVLGGKAVRSGDELRLALDDGKTRTLRDNPRACQAGDQDKCVAYTLSAYRPAERVYVVDYDLAEGGGSLVIPESGAPEVNIDNEVPVFSPSGRTFGAAMSSEVAPPSHDLAIWGVLAGKATLEWAYKNPPDQQALYSLGRWDGENTFKAQVEYTPKGAQEPKVAEVSVERTADGWKLMKPAGVP